MKSTARDHYTSTGMSELTRLTIARAAENMEQLEFSDTDGGDINCDNFGKQLDSLLIS